jgi:regulatory protein
MSEGRQALRSRALRLLGRREHSRAELRRKLLGGDSDDAVDALLDQLEREGYLSEHRFAESFVAARAERFGTTRLRYQLRSKGVDDDAIEGALRTVVEPDLERARRLWRRRYGQPPLDAREHARQTRFLRMRGFSLETIRALLKEMAA